VEITTRAADKTLLSGYAGIFDNYAGFQLSLE
jgi:hypothetical protein